MTHPNLLSVKIYSWWRDRLNGTSSDTCRCWATCDIMHWCLGGGFITSYRVWTAPKIFKKKKIFKNGQICRVTVSWQGHVLLLNIHSSTFVLKVNVYFCCSSLVRSLQKHIPVDIYGKCSRKPCPDQVCFPMLDKDYKFYFAFENSLCEDYVTEKFFKVLRWVWKIVYWNW